MSYSPGDRVKVRRGSRWLACEVMSDDGDGWVVARREDTGKRVIAGAAEVQSAERPARKLPPPRGLLLNETAPWCPGCGAAPGWTHVSSCDGKPRTARANPLPISPQPKPQKAARSPSYLAWVRTFPCLCGCGETPVEAHHFGPRAKGTKASDFRAVPLSVRCHRGFHDTGSLPCFREARVPEPRVHTERAFYEAQARLLIEWLDIVQERKARRG